MKQIICNILKWLGYLLLIVCALGLVLALVGLIFHYDPLYYAGLILASPLFMIVLPFCLLLLVLFYCGLIYKIISCFRKPRPDSKTDEEIMED